MLEWVRRLLLQTRCAYCSKPLSQDEEIRFGKISLCPDCFNHLGLAHSLAHSQARSKLVSVANSTALSKVKPGTFRKRHIREKRNPHSKAHSSGDIQYVLEQFHGLFLVRVIK